MDLSPNSGKSILELTPDGFVLSEFISRMIEIKKKNFEICVRFLEGNRTTSFRQTLMTLAEHLAGKSLEEVTGPIYDEVKQTVTDYLTNPNRDSTVYSQLKEAFYTIVNDIDDLTISKSELHKLLREFTGTNMDFDVDQLAESLGVENTVNFEELKEIWADGPGKNIINKEIYEHALLSGQFIKFCYKTLGVIEELEQKTSTPDDFATNYEILTDLRSSNLKLLNQHTFTVQTPIIL